MNIPYPFILGFLTLGLVAFALYKKGDVKAACKVLGIELSIEAKDRTDPPQIKEETGAESKNSKMMTRPVTEYPSDFKK